MNKKLLCAALLSGLAVAQIASAQDFDDRWYVTGDIGYNHQDSSRDTENAMFAATGASTASRLTCVVTSSPKAATGIRTS